MRAAKWTVFFILDEMETLDERFKVMVLEDPGAHACMLARIADVCHHFGLAPVQHEVPETIARRDQQFGRRFIGLAVLSFARLSPPIEFVIV